MTAVPTAGAEASLPSAQPGTNSPEAEDDFGIVAESCAMRPSPDLALAATEDASDDPMRVDKSDATPEDTWQPTGCLVVTAASIAASGSPGPALGTTSNPGEGEGEVNGARKPEKSEVCDAYGISENRPRTSMDRHQGLPPLSPDNADPPIDVDSTVGESVPSQSTHADSAKGGLHSLLAILDGSQSQNESARLAHTANAGLPQGIAPKGLQGSHSLVAEAAPVRELREPIMSPRWRDKFVESIAVSLKHGQHKVCISLTPAELGPIEVRIELRSNDASIHFVAGHADTRTAIDSALPRLREMFNGLGMSLADASVSQGHGQREMPRMFQEPSGPVIATETDVLSALGPVAIPSGLVDAYI
ncbi:MAG: flagellar hook-length control protein FliK [Steroidobacteraceae bacterium]